MRLSPEELKNKMEHRTFLYLRKTLFPAALAGTLALATAGCMGPMMSPVVPDAGWNTNYEDALSPHTQLALGVMQALKDDPAAIPSGNRAEIARRWRTLASLIEAKAPPAAVNNARLEVEHALGESFVNKLKAEQPTRGDLMGFMMSSGVRVPKGGMASLNPDHVAASKAVEALGK